LFRRLIPPAFLANSTDFSRIERPHPVVPRWPPAGSVSRSR
jgi:hypothetical protein